MARIFSLNGPECFRAGNSNVYHHGIMLLFFFSRPTVFTWDSLKLSPVGPGDSLFRKPKNITACCYILTSMGFYIITGLGRERG